MALIHDARVNSVKEFQATFEQFGFHFQSFPLERGKFHARIRIAVLGEHVFFDWETNLSIACVGDACNKHVPLTFTKPNEGAVGTLTTLGGEWGCQLGCRRSPALSG